jgi:hypothetical protein
MTVTVWPVSVAPGITTVSNTTTMAAPSTLAAMSVTVSSDCTRTRSATGRWPTDPSSREPNG